MVVKKRRKEEAVQLRVVGSVEDLLLLGNTFREARTVQHIFRLEKGREVALVGFRRQSRTGNMIGATGKKGRYEVET